MSDLSVSVEKKRQIVQLYFDDLDRTDSKCKGVIANTEGAEEIINKVEVIKLDMSANVLDVLQTLTPLNPVHRSKTRWSYIQSRNECTSNAVERLFSTARLVYYTDYRRSMKPKSLELILFLKANRKLWSLKTTVPIVSSNADDDSNENVADY